MKYNLKAIMHYWMVVVGYGAKWDDGSEIVVTYDDFKESEFKDHRKFYCGFIHGELDPMTNAFIQMSGVFAELELRIIRERVRSGMRNAKAKGARIGRPQTTLDDIPANFLRHYPQYKKGAFNLTELARLCDISRTTAYKYIGLLEGSNAICR